MVLFNNCKVNFEIEKNQISIWTVVLVLKNNNGGLFQNAFMRYLPKLL